MWSKLNSHVITESWMVLTSLVVARPLLRLRSRMKLENQRNMNMNTMMTLLLSLPSSTLMILTIRTQCSRLVISLVCWLRECSPPPWLLLQVPQPQPRLRDSFQRDKSSWTDFQQDLTSSSSHKLITKAFPTFPQFTLYLILFKLWNTCF